MKLESDKDLKTAEIFLGVLKKMKADNLSIPEAYSLVASMEWIISAMNEFKKPKVESPVIPPITNSVKAKHVRTK